MSAARRAKGGTGWLLLFGGVAVWDALAPETMSAAFRRATATPEGRLVVFAGWAVLTAHLFDVLPEQADPFAYVIKAARYRRILSECRAL